MLKFSRFLYVLLFTTNLFSIEYKERINLDFLVTKPLNPLKTNINKDDYL